jgi:hypothetical protein
MNTIKHAACRLPHSLGPRTQIRCLAAVQPPQHPRRPFSTSPARGSSKKPLPNLPEFSLVGKVVLVSGAARGLGLVQAEALMEAGAVVYALDRLPTPSAEFKQVQARAERELGTRFEYKQMDVTDVPGLNVVVDDIAKTEGRIDGLIAAAGIQQETPALEYKASDAK